MKKIIFSILVVLLAQSITGQNQSKFSNLIDTLLIKEINSYKDTLWVMDSSYSYNRIDNELVFSGKYNVLTRGESGNKLSGIGKNNRYGQMENSYLDSVIYFNGTNNVNNTKTYSWSYEYNKWMDNNYQLFNNDHNTIERYNKGWNMYQNEYINGSKITYVYELQTTVTSYNYFPENNEWLPNDKSFTFYDNFGKDSIRLNQIWINNQWVNEVMVKLYYNTQKQDSLILELVWDITSEEWINNYKRETIYNDVQNSSDCYSFLWDKESGVWVNDVYTHTSSTETGLIDTSINYIWDNITVEWLNNKQFIITYDETGKILDYENLLYDSYNNIWIKDRKDSYVYNDDFIERITYNGDSESNNWIPNNRIYLSYAYDNVIDSIQYNIWDTISQKWVSNHRFINIFDNRLNHIGSIYESWNNTDESWLVMQKTDYFWSPFNPLDINETNTLNEQVKIYPNPATNTLIVELEDGAKQQSLLEIYNSTGSKVYSSEVENTITTIDVNSWNSGIYIVKIINTGAQPTCDKSSVGKADACASYRRKVVVR